MLRATPAAALVLVLLLAPALPGAAWQMAAYRQSPVDHDDLGRAAEPDFAATSVLGPLLLNRVLDAPPFGANPAGGAVADAAPGALNPHAALGAPWDRVAPGCSISGPGGAPERLRSGVCGLRTVGAGAAGLQALPPGGLGAEGMDGTAAPGAYTPTQASDVRFLDAQLAFAAPGGWTSPQRAAEDSGVAALQGLAPVPPLLGLWAWYGQWRDGNGNGVIDHHTPGTAEGPNEFTWLGSCVDFDAEFIHESLVEGLCAEDPNPHLQPPGQPCPPQATMACAGTTLHAWLWPGNHHAGPSDAPAMQAVRFAVRGLDCTSPPTCDDDARAEAGRGDPLLDEPGSAIPDTQLRDSTGDNDYRRGWFGLAGEATLAWDAGSVAHLVVVVGANCAPSALEPSSVVLGSCTFLDVDHHAAVSPALDAALQGAVKPLARGAWALARDASPPLARALDAHARGAFLHHAAQGPLVGAALGIADPGWSREPNHPGDSYVGVAWGPCAPDAWPTPGAARHRGWCNVASASHGHLPGEDAHPYDAYAGSASRGWSDGRLVRSALYPVPVTVAGPCALCFSGPWVDTGLDGPTAGVAPDAEHRRTIAPGQYYVGGAAGRWRDVPHLRDETVFPGPPAWETYPSDGWVGFLARSTGQLRYRGYADLGDASPCVTERGPVPLGGARPAAECNPYLDGFVADPQDLAPHHPLYAPQEEWQGACHGAGLEPVSLVPADGVWDAQFLVWRGHDHGIGPLLEEGSLNPDFPFDPHHGSLDIVGPGPATQPVLLSAGCVHGGAAGAWRTFDYLIWPQGNVGDEVLVTHEVHILLGLDLDGDGVDDADTIRDVDAYRPWA